ncbi:preprotein translocase subunit SecE [Cognatilysobacter lacus]|uniref:Protein translocase subunit SecE n=1 Tax=Cognatilysobacter lacus TaxID=1643323 RepID=A0A5D8ZAV1_9GAMM|nr:preprotein translocase subunit SecE [Lysobacter lacus]TZF91676.1 preprotein translocase subunit SecE [Lysobacter lacus]
MNTKVVPNRGAQPGGTAAVDIAKYVVAVLLVAAGIFGFYWFADLSTPVRAIMVIAGVLAGALLFATSGRGGRTRSFLSESRFELRKVVWPTRQEALRTTWVVMLAVLILSVLLAGFDVVIQALVKLLLGR